MHVFTAPLGYLTRPYIVYRSRDDQLGSRHAPARMGTHRGQDHDKATPTSSPPDPSYPLTTNGVA